MDAKTYPLQEILRPERRYIIIAQFKEWQRRNQ